jgi:hypothetical protein
VVPNHNGVLLYLTLVRLRIRQRSGRSDRPSHCGARWRVEPGRTPRSNSIADAHAVEFSKTAEPLQKSPSERPIRPGVQGRSMGQPQSIALIWSGGCQVAELIGRRCGGDPHWCHAASPGAPRAEGPA